MALAALWAVVSVTSATARALGRIQPPPIGFPPLVGSVVTLGPLGPAPAPAPAPFGLWDSRLPTVALAVAGPPPVSRNEVCEVCYRECPVNCFTGPCGLEYPLGVYRYKDTPHCYSCDGIANQNLPGGDSLTLCTVEEAAAPPATSLSLTMDEATKDAAKHSLAAQIRAAQALSASDAAHMAWKASADRYNSLLPELRALQLKLHRAEEVMDHSAQVAAVAKDVYFKAVAEVQQANRKQMVAATEAAYSASQTAPANQQGPPSMAEYRRMLVAQDDAATKYRQAAAAAIAAKPTEPPKPEGLDQGLTQSTTRPPCPTGLLAVRARETVGRVGHG